MPSLKQHLLSVNPNVPGRQLKDGFALRSGLKTSHLGSDAPYSKDTALNSNYYEAQMAKLDRLEFWHEEEVRNQYGEVQTMKEVNGHLVFANPLTKRFRKHHAEAYEQRQKILEEQEDYIDGIMHLFYDTNKQSADLLGFPTVGDYLKVCGPQTTTPSAPYDHIAPELWQTNCTTDYLRQFPPDCKMEKIILGRAKLRQLIMMYRPVVESVGTSEAKLRDDPSKNVQVDAADIA